MGASETTALPPEREAEFRQWLARNRIRDLDHPDSHYDYRGAFLAGIGRGADSGHFPDTFKQHGHPTFSVESRYSKGPGDGGSWNGETFIPAKPVNEPIKLLPGQRPLAGVKYSPLTLPGVNDAAAPRPENQEALDRQDGLGFAPFGMRPGVKHVLPEQIDLDAPEKVTLDESPAPTAAPAAAPEPAAPAEPKPVGRRFRDREGHVISEQHNVDTKGYQLSQIDAVGKSLLDQAIDPNDQESAKRVLAYGRSMAGIATTAEITKRMVQLYENDQHNLTSRKVQEEKSKRAAMRGSGGGGPVGPTKADKFNFGLDKELNDRVEHVIESERKDSKHAVLAQQDNAIGEMDAMLSRPNAMAQRVAVQKALLELTGKASRESEQAALTGAAGKWNELQNKLALWTSDDPTLSRAYIAQFRSMLAGQREYIRQLREVTGKAAAERAAAQAFGYPDEQRQLAYDIAYGAMTGKYQGAAAHKPTAAPNAGKVDDDLLK